MKTENLFWNIYAHVYDLMIFNPPYPDMMKKVATHISPNSLKILDAGCGTGNLEKYLFAKRRDLVITAVDISESMFKRAKIKNQNDNIQVQKVDLDKKLPFDNNNFDCVISLNTLYSVNNPSFTISEFQRVLKKNGKLIIVNPDEKANVKDFYKGILDSVSIIYKPILFLLNLPLFVFNVIIKMKAGNLVYHFWNDRNWIELLKKNNFVDMKSQPIYIQGHLISALKK